MKLFILLSIILFLFSKCNIHTCSDDTTYTLTIQNKTSKNVTITTYRYNNKINHKRITSNSDYFESLTFRDCDRNYLEYDEVFFYDIDSIVIVYDRRKFKIFTCGKNNSSCSEPRNPLYYKYNLTPIEYTITEEDYQNAEDCDGRCE